MEFSTITNVEPARLLDFDADVFITTLGFETRCTSVARLYEGKRCRKIALSRTDHLKEFSFRENRTYYQEHNFEIIPVEKKVPDVDSLLVPVKKERIKILLDCTSMSPRWYYEFFRWFSESQELYQTVTLRIAYTMAGYTGSDHPRKVKAVREFLESQRNPDDLGETVLIMGLGHEKQIGQSIYNIVKPDLLYLFYADPPVEKKFVEKTFVNNHSLIEATPIRNLIAYPIHNGQAIYHSLINTILPLRNRYTIVIVPHGPKIFSLVAMLVQAGYPDAVISYPVFKKSPAVDRIPSGDPVLLDLIFEGDE